ncbi:MAG: multidrug efflux SMR transporter [Cellvibrionaceae bacterium]|nr:multidrug efflux SMR transporter [Cellvibrionaceae bacterium]
MKAWVFLLLAGIFECVWAIALKYSDGLSKPVPVIVVVLGTIASFYFLSSAMKLLPVGVAYSVWVGVGAIGVSILGIIMFGESRSIAKIFCLLLIVIGIAGLKFLKE